MKVLKKIYLYVIIIFTIYILISVISYFQAKERNKNIVVIPLKEKESVTEIDVSDYSEEQINDILINGYVEEIIDEER